MSTDLSASAPAVSARRRVANQGAMLFAGYAAAQGLSFVRNAMVGHVLSKGDFGIAATITLLLQIIETVSDMGSDRLIVQAEDGDSDEMLGASHAMVVVRGAGIAALMVALGPALASFFLVPHAAAVFQLAGLAALIKGFSHLDWRRAQRRLDNRPHLAVEVVPQAIVLAATLPALIVIGGYTAVVWLAIIQATAALAISHVLARAPYRIAFDAAAFKRQIAFGWPILASALPLVAVYQADRIVIARVIGMEPLASYTAAFMITMVPGLIAAKVGHALMLPLFSDSRRTRGSLARPFAPMAEATAVFAALYLGLFLIAGGPVLRLVFGPNYAGLDVLVCWLAAMWALRMIQAVPGMALMAAGQTRPFLIAGIIRACALPFVVVLAMRGAGIETIAAIGCGFEALSLLYVSLRLNRLEGGLGWLLLRRTAFLAPVAFAGCLLAGSIPLDSFSRAVAGFGMAGLIAACGVATMPNLRALVRGKFVRSARAAVA